MEPTEAFETTAKHADKRHDHIVRAIGEDALSHALELNSFSEAVLHELDDEDWERYLSSHLTQGETENTEDLPTDRYRDADVEFSTLAGERFGEVDGYTLFGADEHGLILQKSVLDPSMTAIHDMVRLYVTPTPKSIELRKVRQTIDKGNSEVADLLTDQEDEATAHRALERLKQVNESLD